MKLNDYQTQAMKFAKFASRDYPFVALTEEAGEVSGKLAKAARKWEMCIESVLENTCIPDRFQSEREMILKVDLAHELGDTLWQLQACADQLGYTLEEIALMNLHKLKGRDERGTIIGDGDHR